MFGKFCFNSVGQGLFYSGKIRTDYLKFNLVYDCGSLPKNGFIDREIANYDREYCGEKIDLLVISHFDSDHINGIPDLLLKHGVKVIVMPYLNAKERILLGLSVVDSDLGDEEKERLIAFYYNPIAYLDDYADKVVWLYGGDERYDDLQGELLDGGPLEWDAFERNNCDRWVVRRPSFSFITDEWEFVFYNKRVDKNQIDDYFNAVNDTLNSLGYTIEQLHGMMRDYKAFASFKKSIKEKMPHKNMNDNSVIMYHGPLYNYCGPMYSDYWETPQSFSNDIVNITDSASKEHFPQNSCRCGTLLTGDYSTLDTDWHNIVDEFGATRILRVGHFQVPHHGAKSCFNGYGNFDNCVISYGTRNTYKHPNNDVLYNIARSKAQLQLVNEWHSYVYYIEK